MSDAGLKSMFSRIKSLTSAGSTSYKDEMVQRSNLSRYAEKVLRTFKIV